MEKFENSWKIHLLRSFTAGADDNWEVKVRSSRNSQQAAVPQDGSRLWSEATPLAPIVALGGMLAS